MVASILCFMDLKGPQEARNLQLLVREGVACL